MSLVLKYSELHETLKANQDVSEEEKKNILIKYILQKFDLKDDKRVQDLIVNKIRKSFLNNYNKRVASVKKIHKGLDYFEIKCSDWLQNEFSFSLDELVLEIYEQGKLRNISIY